MSPEQCVRYLSLSTQALSGLAPASVCASNHRTRPNHFPLPFLRHGSQWPETNSRSGPKFLMQLSRNRLRDGAEEGRDRSRRVQRGQVRPGRRRAWRESGVTRPESPSSRWPPPCSFSPSRRAANRCVTSTSEERSSTWISCRRMGGRIRSRTIPIAQLRPAMSRRSSD